MRILYLSQYFPPEIGATQSRALEMARSLVEAGHRVTMVTEFPNHPHGVVPPAYKGKLWKRSRLDGIDVIRVWVKASPKKTFGARLAFYLSFLFMAAFAGIFLARGKHHLVYATSPPLFVGAAARLVRFARRVPMVFEVRDLWPESAVQLGELRNPTIRRLTTRFEEQCYHLARLVVVVSEGIKSDLIHRGVPASKVVLVPNGANTVTFRPRPRDPVLRRELGIPEEAYVVTYTGLVGLVADVDTILGAARLLERREERIVFLIVGDGPRLEEMKRMASETTPGNLVFHDLVPERELPRFLSVADLGIHANRDLEICRGGLPVKLFSYMASGLPVVLSGEGEPARLVEQAGAGLVAPPEDPGALASAILSIKNQPALTDRFHAAGVAFVRSRYSRRHLGRRLVSALEHAAGRQKA